MRSLLSIVLVVFSCGSISAQHPSQEATIQWLKQHMPGPTAGHHHNFTTMCRNINLLPGDKALDAASFKTRITSAVSWQQDQMVIQNEIVDNSKPLETYVYHIPLSAISSVSQTNCQVKTDVNVNGYTDRPIFLGVKKGKASIHHIVYDKTGKVVSATDHLNSSSGDWESLIPIAGNWDAGPAMRNKVLDAFTRLADNNKSRSTATATTR